MNYFKTFIVLMLVSISTLTHASIDNCSEDLELPFIEYAHVDSQSKELVVGIEDASSGIIGVLLSSFSPTHGFINSNENAFLSILRNQEGKTKVTFRAVKDFSTDELLGHMLMHLEHNFFKNKIRIPFAHASHKAELRISLESEILKETPSIYLRALDACYRLGQTEAITIR